MSRALLLFFLLNALPLLTCAQRSDDSLAILRQARRDVATLAHPRMGGRGYTDGGHRRAADYIAQRLAKLGYAVEQQRFTAAGTLAAKLDSGWVGIRVDSITTQNVIGVWRGARVPDSAIVICAHYDHLGTLTHDGRRHVFTGANDNASGVALLLHLAQRLRQSNYPYTVVVIAFGAEELGLLGSQHYVRQPVPLPLERIAMVWNLDLVGFGERGLVAVGGITPQRDTLPMARRLLAANASMGSSSSIAPLSLRPHRPNSDHWPFAQAGVPALFLFTEGGPGHYHDVLDRAPTLTLHSFVRLARLIERALRLP